MNADELIAIDFHTHAEEPCCGPRDDGYDEFQAGMAAYFRNPAGAQGMLPTVQQTADYFRERKIGAVIFPVDAERETGFRRYSNEEVARIAAENADILIPFASIDPAKGKAGAREAKRLVREFGVRGFKFHPTMQGFFPNDRMAYPLYEAISPKATSSPTGWLRTGRFIPCRLRAAPPFRPSWRGRRSAVPRPRG